MNTDNINPLVLSAGEDPTGDAPHYETPVIADFNDLLYRMNVMIRRWADIHYPGQLVLLYEFQGWYVKQEPDEGAVSIAIDSEHGEKCRGVYTVLQHNGEGYINIPTLFVHFSDSNLDKIYVEEVESPFIESNFPGDFPPHGAYLALYALRNVKNDENFFNEGWVTYRLGVLPVMAEPVYQFGEYMTEEFHTVGALTMRVDVPPGYDNTIPHTPWPGIDPEPAPVPEPTPVPEPVRPNKVPFDSFDFNNDGIVQFSEYYNM